uniref:RNase H type-1 domain-containing protein n=1 Tax=Opuntia streptacantha TaxID=393608 RepID=A0A7C9DB70_OPUST
MRNGIKAAVHSGFQNIHVEGDNKTLIQALTDRIDVPWLIHTLVQDIKLYLQQCNNVIITHIFREGNHAADWVAKQGLSLRSTVVWNEVPHRDLMLILEADNLGRTLERRAS